MEDLEWKEELELRELKADRDEQWEREQQQELEQEQEQEPQSLFSTEETQGPDPGSDLVVISPESGASDIENVGSQVELTNKGML